MSSLGCDAAAKMPLETPSSEVRRSRREITTELGSYLSEQARRATSGFFSYERLGCELEAQSAPRTLVALAHRCGDDELRHAQLLKKLALARGGTLHEVRVRALEPRNLEQIATANAITGCVHETYGALLSAFQAEHAADAELREVLAVIARVELRHAAFAQRVHGWALSRLDAASRGRVLAAQEAALRELSDTCAVDASFELVRTAGLPSAREARELVKQLSRRLWAPRRDQAA